MLFAIDKTCFSLKLAKFCLCQKDATEATE